METTPETIPKQLGNGGEGRFWLRGVVATGLGMLAIAAGWQYKEVHSGQKQAYEPLESSRVYPDGQITAVSWNMHHEAERYRFRLRRLIDQEQPDAVMLQEVESEAIGPLRRTLPNWHLSYVVGDIKDDILSGGMGNAILTRQEQRRVTSSKINGTSFIESAWGVLKGATQGIAEASSVRNGLRNGVAEAKDGFQANRSSLAATIRYSDGSSQRDLRLVTSHISADRAVRAEQMSEMMSFVDKQIKKDRPTIVCVDANTGSRKMIPEFARAGLISGHNTKPTTKNRTQPIDHCAFSGVEKIGMDSTSVIPGYFTDHKPIKITFDPHSFPMERPNT